jgi:hypothetical protein
LQHEEEDNVTTMSRRDELTKRGRESALRLADLVHSLDEREASSPVPVLDWTAIETAAHVVNLYGRGLGDMRRSLTPAGTAELNATCLAEYTERDPILVADRIAADAAMVWDEMLPMLPDDLEVPFHAGAHSTVVPIMGVLLMEMVVHGRDIALATGRTWAVTDDDAWCALSAVAPLLPAWRRAGVAAHDTISIVGPAGCAVRTIWDGEGVVVASGPCGEHDRVVAESPSAALLGILGRLPSTAPLADLARRFGPF